MSTTDPYHDAAFLNTAMICDSCTEVLDSNDLSGGPNYPEEGWDQALGDAAKERGWIVSEADDAIFGYVVFCPSCAVKLRK